MKCHILFSGKNKKNISKYRLLKILPRVLSVNICSYGCGLLIKMDTMPIYDKISYKSISREPGKLCC